MQGSDKRKITSKDILSSLSEAKESHMMQQSGDPPPQSSGLDSSNQAPPFRNLEPELARNDPWSVPQRNAESGSPHQAGMNQLQPEEVFVDVKLKRSWCGLYGCVSCLTCACLRQQSWRRLQRTSSPGGVSDNLTSEEERAYLMRCDELAQDIEEGD